MHKTRTCCSRLRMAKTRGELSAFLFEEVNGFTLYDLQHLRGVLEHEFKALPPYYRKKLYPKAMEQIFGTHHALIHMYRSGQLKNHKAPLDPLFAEYCDMVEKTVLAEPDLKKQKFDLLYFLLAAFNLFVIDLPGHPIGTPFPGGMTVEEKNGEYLCPVQGKTEGVENSICPFCSAKNPFDEEMPKKRKMKK
jgi:uncharacterized protein (UPF0305 family)